MCGRVQESAQGSAVGAVLWLGVETGFETGGPRLDVDLGVRKAANSKREDIFLLSGKLLTNLPPPT